jgi:phenylpyruvate tautomerase PptA (4-oxalocrotonate tautomerase family)
VPFLQVHTARKLSTDVKRALGTALASAYGELMQTSRLIVNVGFVQYGEGDLARYDGEGGAPREMAIVTVDVRAGRSAAQHETLGRTLATICAEALGIAEERVAVYITEHAGQHIYRDGGRAPDWSAAEAAREKPPASQYGKEVSALDSGVTIDTI